jgi:hypothetical protein
MHFRSVIRDLPKSLGRRTSFGEIPCSLNGSSESVDSLASVMKLNRKRGDASSRKALSLVPPQPKMTYIRYSASFLPISFSSLNSPPPRSQYDRNFQSSFRKPTNVPVDINSSPRCSHSSRSSHFSSPSLPQPRLISSWLTRLSLAMPSMAYRSTQLAKASSLVAHLQPTVPQSSVRHAQM